MAAGLVAMAARFSREQWEDAAGVAAQAESVRARVAPLAQEDAEAYEDVLTAMRLPKDLDADIRNRLLGDALSRAAEVPLRIAEAAADVAELGALVADRGNPNLRGDATAAALLAQAAVRAAANLVEINLGTRPDDERRAKAGELVSACGRAVDHALAAGS
jgi:formiminotetrahydrofolate cyclodeaminase